MTRLRRNYNHVLEGNARPGVWSDDIMQSAASGRVTRRKVDNDKVEPARTLPEEEHDNHSYWFLDPLSNRLVPSESDGIAGGLVHFTDNKTWLHFSPLFLKLIYYACFLKIQLWIKCPRGDFNQAGIRHKVVLPMMTRRVREEDKRKVTYNNRW